MNILKNGYNREDFRTLVNDIFEKSEIFLDIPEDQEVSDDKIESGYLLGELELNGKDFAIFEYKVKDELDLEKNRVGLNKKLIKNGKEYLYDALLGVYYNEKTKIWRLSLVNIEYTENKEKTTSLKRYTYLLGENIPVNTAIKQIKSELINKKVNDIDNLLKAFSVEPVTKEFFKRYKEIFEEFNEYSYKNNANAQLFNNIPSDIHKKIRDFNKKLLGRLVFLMFLQKKGWLDAKSSNYTDGNKNFLSALYKKAIKEGKLFYNEYLEPLFYDTLNKRRENDIFFITGKKVPFLNGGLFEKEEYETSILMQFSNELFSLLLDEKDGLFKQYNFTIIENDSTDQEVAVDPEMLGHIFENLLEDNKDKGAFYTPKEIVDYMSKSSLLEYLKNGFEEKKGTLEEKEEEILKELVFSPEIADFRIHFVKNNKDLINMLLDKVKILDPAIGSGAFPMGMLQAIIRVKEVLDHNLNRGEAKRNIIENSIYGVDIESGAVDIARLRFWLSLVVDEDIPTPLPNLDFKIVVGNSLIGLKEKKKVMLDFGNVNSDIENLHEIRKKYLIAYGKEKNDLKNDFKSLQRDILYKEKESGNLASNERVQQLIKWNPFEHSNHNWFDPSWMYGVDKFDIVIGNPPYIMEDENKNAFDNLHYHNCYQGKTDIWHIFTCTGLGLLKNNGILSFIAKNQWLESSSASKMRKIIYKESEILSIINFNNNMIFSEASQQTMIFFLKKNNNNKHHNIIYQKYLKIIPISQIEDLLNTPISNNLLRINQKKIIKKYNEKENLTFSKYEELLNKIEHKKNFNFNDKEVIQGIIGAPDKHFIIKQVELSIFNENEKSFLKMLHTNTARYHTPQTNKYIFYIHKKNFNNKNIKDFSNIENFFEPNKNELIQKKIQYETPSKPYFYLHRERDDFFFKEGEKIVFASRTTGRNFTYTVKEFYGTRNLFFIKSTRISLKYIVALLNSKLMYFYMNERLKHTGSLLQIDKNQFMKIPLYNIKNIIFFDSLINEIIYLKKEKKDTQILEDKIDLMVYKLYELNYDEIKIIDADFDVVLNQLGIDKVEYEGLSIEEVAEL